MLRAEQFLVTADFRRTVKRRLRGQREKADHSEPDAVEQDRPADQREDDDTARHVCSSKLLESSEHTPDNVSVLSPNTTEVADPKFNAGDEP